MKTLFELCSPRQDILSGGVNESDYAADLAQVLRGEGPEEYRDAATFFANTHPTQGLRALLENVCRRLSGAGGEAASIFRLDTQYGGGKTHALIALAHLVRSGHSVPTLSEFLNPELLPTSEVHIGVFDGENSDPFNGRLLDGGLRAYTPWGELACQLGGAAGYRKVRDSDQERMAPGAETLRSLFEEQPSLILLDELSIYLRRIRRRTEEQQLTPFLTNLFKAVAGSPNAVLVFTLALDKEGQAQDAYAEENEWLGQQLQELTSVAGRKATLIDPTTEDETAQVLRRRLFGSINEAGAGAVVDAYLQLWRRHADQLPPPSGGESPELEFRKSFPFHPNLMHVLTDKLSTLDHFQRVRGMLRLLASAVAEVWARQEPGTHALHLHHLDPGNDRIRNEIVTRLGLKLYDPAIRNDISDSGSVAQELDRKHHSGLPPLTTQLARTVLWHTFAFNDPLKGVSPDELRFALLAPGVDPSFINDARQRFIQNSGYLDDRPAAPLRYLTEANLNNLIRRKERDVDPGDVRDQLQDRIRQIFQARLLNLIPFPSGPYEVPDEIGDERPLLVLLHYEFVAVGGEPSGVPIELAELFLKQGSQGHFRQLKNNLVFLVAEAERVSGMKEKMTRRLALAAMQTPEQMQALPEHQQLKVQELFQRSEQELAGAIQQAHRHLFFPSRANPLPGGVELAHVTFELPATAAQPGAGQPPILRTLKDNLKLLRDEDDPQAPRYFRDQTLLKHRGFADTAELRSEYRKNPLLPLMLGNDNFLRLLKKGIEEGVWIYQSGAFLVGPGDPPATLKIDSQAQVLTLAYAGEKHLWPRAEPEPEPETPPPDPGSTPPEPEQPPPEPPASGKVFSAEGPLRQALTQLWEAARAAKVDALKSVQMRLFDMQEGFRMLHALSTVKEADKRVELVGSYETASESLCTLDYKGTPEDALPLKDFLEPQFRAAGEKDLQSTCTITFRNGLALGGDEPEQMTERLVRILQGPAHVDAWAEAE